MISFKDYLAFSLKYEVKDTSSDLAIFADTASTSVRFISGLQNEANKCFKQLHSWRSKKQFEIFKTAVQIKKINRNYNSTIKKICSVIEIIWCFLPGILLHSCLWLVDRQNRIKLVNLAINEMKGRKIFKNNFHSHSHIIQSRDFKQPNNQTKSHLAQIPGDLFNYRIFEFLNDKDKALLASSSTLFHKMISIHLNDPKNLVKRFPPQIVEILGQDKLIHVPDGQMQIHWKKIIHSFEDSNNNHLMEHPILNLADTMLMVYIWKCANMHSSTFKEINFPIQKIQRSNGDFAIHLSIKNNITNENENFLFTKHNDKWMVVPASSSAGLWLFLNDIRYGIDTPLVTEYLTRLLKGEPCGQFPQNLNGNFSYNYQTERAADKLVEGPRLCEDGKTPVLQLWPPIQNNIKN